MNHQLELFGASAEAAAVAPSGHSKRQFAALPSETTSLPGTVPPRVDIPPHRAPRGDLFREMFDQHVLGMVHPVQAVLMSMLERSFGRIVAVYEGDANNTMARSRRLAQSVGGEPSEQRSLRPAGFRAPASR